MKTRIPASKQVLAAIATGALVFGAIPAALARTIDLGTMLGITHSIETDLSADAHGDDGSVDVDGSVETDSEIEIETESDGDDSHQSTDVDGSTQASVTTDFHTDDDASMETDAHLQSETSAHLSVLHEEGEDDSDDEDAHETSVESHTHIHLDASADAEEALEHIEDILEELDIEDMLDVDVLLQGGAAAEAEIEAFIE